MAHLLCHAGGLDFDSERVLAAPGTRRIYSNTGYEALAAHVSARTGFAFGEYLAVHIPELDGTLPGWGPQRPCDWGLGAWSVALWPRFSDGVRAATLAVV